MSPSGAVPGIWRNAPQFGLLVVINGFVGAMVGLERGVLPAAAEAVYGVAASAAMLSFILVFGVSKAIANYWAGRLSDRWGRRRVLIGGWLVAVPVPFLLTLGPSWSWVVAANVLLGISQGLTWSTTVIMKVDLAGSAQRGLAMGLNEFAGYLAVGGSAALAGYVAASTGLISALGLGFVYVTVGTLLSVLLVRDTRLFVAHEVGTDAVEVPTDLAAQVTWRDPDLSSASQAGFVNNLNDGAAWGLFPLVYAAAGMSLVQIGWLAAIYPAVWGLGQLFTGPLSDRLGRKPLLVAGMLIQGAAIAWVALAGGFVAFAGAAVLLGAGTALVYPTLLAAVGDVAHPSWRARAIGVYRFWRDIGYAAGALLVGTMADVFDLKSAVFAVSALTFVSGLGVWVRMRETAPHRRAASQVPPMR